MKEVTTIWKGSALFWLVGAFLLGIAIYIFRDGLSVMVGWWEREEYSHGYLVPLIVLFIIWQKKDILERIPFNGSWAGVVLVICGMMVYFLGELSAIYTVVQYGFLITLYGIVLGIVGWNAFSKIWVPLLILGFMVPLPSFLYNNLSSNLQLISSQIGVWFIRLFDISVYLEGNVIDLGGYKLQVVEACSGLRYLFPLMTLGFIAAYFYNASFWKRALVFLSSIPITILMNSLRIGAIGVTVEFWGQSMADGFLHDFEGWTVFMACTAILVIEMWMLSFFGKDRKPLREVFGIDFPAPSPQDANTLRRDVRVQSYVTIVVLLATATMSTQVTHREEIIPGRTNFAQFPMEIDQWHGVNDRLESIYIDALKFDDHLLANYISRNGEPVNLYIAYYSSQKKGESAHSPRSCIPGGGWLIQSLDQITLKDTSINGIPLSVNRVVIRQGDQAQVVYYWFQGRNRIITNEYLVKWYLFRDSLTQSRSDGALVRLTAFVGPGVDISDADRLLETFAHDVAGLLPDYIPD